MYPQIIWQAQQLVIQMRQTLDTLGTSQERKTLRKVIKFWEKIIARRK